MLTRVTLNKFFGSLFSFATALGFMLASASVNAAEIYGRVTRADGKTPVVNTPISLNGRPAGKTDASGSYRLSLPPGQYTLNIGGKDIRVSVPPSGVSKNIKLQ